MDPSIPNTNINNIYIKLVIWLAVASILSIQTVYANNQKLELYLAARTIEQLQDPTMPKRSASDNMPDSESADLTKVISSDHNLQLTIILISKEDKTAVINEQIVREQDVIGEYQVIHIKSNKVVLKKNLAEKSSEKNQDQAEKKEELFVELRLPAVNIKQ